LIKFIHTITVLAEIFTALYSGRPFSVPEELPAHFVPAESGAAGGARISGEERSSSRL